MFDGLFFKIMEYKYIFFLFNNEFCKWNKMSFYNIGKLVLKVRFN